MVKRSLDRAEIVVDYDRSLRDARRPLGLPEGAVLLYPGPDARDLATLAPAERPNALVVIDGTWHQARTLYRELPALQALPKVSFDASRPSRYRIRKQPRMECVSTLEAVVRALELLEPGLEHLEGLLGSFEAMIDLQLATAARRQRAPRTQRKRRARKSGLPDWLRDEPERHVLVYGEAAFVGPEADRAKGRRLAAMDKTLIQWTALRPATGEVFSSLIRPPFPPLERRLCPTGLVNADLEAAGTLDGARSAWRAWLHEGDRLLCWNKSTLDVMDALETPRPAHFLKGVYKNFAHRRDPGAGLGGSIDAVVEREALRAEPVAVPGRAARRLAELAAITEFLVANADAPTTAPPPESARRIRDADSGANPAKRAACA